MCIVYCYHHSQKVISKQWKTYNHTDCYGFLYNFLFFFFLFWWGVHYARLFRYIYQFGLLVSYWLFENYDFDFTYTYATLNYRISHLFIFFTHILLFYVFFFNSIVNIHTKRSNMDNIYKPNRFVLLVNLSQTNFTRFTFRIPIQCTNDILNTSIACNK